MSWAGNFFPHLQLFVGCKQGSRRFLCCRTPDGAFAAPSRDTTGGLSLVAATSDGGVAISDSQLGTIQLDANGNASQPVTGNAPTNSWSGQWFNIPSSGSGVESIAMRMVVDPDSVWATPRGNPSASGAAGALCACDIQADPAPPPPPPPPSCPICKLRPPDCTPVSVGSGSTYLILVGDPGINGPPGHQHNVGPDFALSAQTQAGSLQSQGHKVVACRVSSVQDVEGALTTHGMIDGGIFYFGHAGVTTYQGDQNIYSALFVGQAQGLYTNITAKTVSILTNAELGSNVVMTLNACNAGQDTADGNPPIAHLLAEQLKITVEAYAGYMHFSKSDAEDDQTVNGGGVKPSGLPMYMNADGAPPRPQPTYFYPPH